MSGILRISLIVIISVIIFIQCGRERPESISEEMKTDMQLLPGSGIGLAYLNLEHLRSSTLYKDLLGDDLKKGLNNSIYRRFAEKTGFDIQEDLNQVYMVMLSGQELSEESGFILAKGSFDAAKLNSFMEEQESDDETLQNTYKEWSIFSFDDGKFSFVIADASTILAGKETMIRQTLDNLKNGSAATASAHWEDFVKPVQYKTDMFITLSTTEIMEILDKSNPNFGHKALGSIKSIQEFNFSAKLEDDIQVTGTGQFADDEKASLFFDAFKGALATLKLSTSEDRNLIDILNKVKLSQHKSLIRIDFEMTMDDTKKLKETEKYFNKVRNIAMK